MRTTFCSSIFFVLVSMLGLLSGPSNQAVSQELKGQLIWGLPNSKGDVGTTVFYFRKVIEVAKFEKVTVDITCDDGYRLFVNGRLIGSDKIWQSVERYDVTSAIKNGKNVICVQAENQTVSPAGLYAKVAVQVGRKTEEFVTNKSWKFSTIPSPGWRFEAFSDQNWKPAFQQGQYGKVDPWGGQFVTAKKSIVISPITKAAKRRGFELLDGDRVVFLGGTFLERMQTNDYVETMLTTQYPNKRISFRNLGWSGDNVFGVSRAVFGSQAVGFRRLENDVRLTQPTLIIVSYGRNESFSGEEYLPEFLRGLESLVDVLQTTDAEIAFLSPSLMENLGSPLPNPDSQNKLITVYANAIREFAVARDHHFIENLKPLGSATVSKTSVPAIRDRLTDNGIHLNDYGYWRIASEFSQKFGAKPHRCELSFDVTTSTYSATKTTLHTVSFDTSSIRFSALDDFLPFSPAPSDTPRGGKMMAIHDLVKVAGLPPGKYGLKINGKPTIMAPAEQWNAGVLINRGNYIKQVEDLRQKILRKNEMFFHRYRPQNETYLFLFRKHEQGNNAVEIPKFDPIIEQLENEIEALKKPQVIKYSLEKIEAQNQTSR